MKIYHISFLVGLFLIACKPETAQSPLVKAIEYPPAIQKVFEAHGGLDIWKGFKAMSYEIEKEEINEKQFIDLNDRRERIEASNVTMGFDGKDFWMEADTSYKGNPIFYKNLMFYFYAMPFVLADDGIQYTEVEPLTFEGQSYPGFRISYDDNVGVSPEDEYFIHYHPDTHQMEWLGYTVTYYSKEKSTKIKWIRYDDWAKNSGLILPNSLAWHTAEDNKPLAERNRVNFTDVIISTEPHDDGVFVKTEGAENVTE